MQFVHYIAAIMQTSLKLGEYMHSLVRWMARVDGEEHMEVVEWTRQLEVRADHLHSSSAARAAFTHVLFALDSRHLPYLLRFISSMRKSP
jgi:hypothetical protein